MARFMYHDKVYEIEDQCIPSELPASKIQELLTNAIDQNVFLTDTFVKRYLRAAVQEKPLDKVIQNYQFKGNIKNLPNNPKEETVEHLSNQFRSRFHNHVPREKTLNAVAAMYDFYGKNKGQPYTSPDDQRDKEKAAKERQNALVSKFHVGTVAQCLKTLAPCEVAMLYTNYDRPTCIALAETPKIADYVCQLLSKGYIQGDSTYISAANWIAAHHETNEDLIKKVYQEADRLKLEESMTVDAVLAKCSLLKALNEVQKVEKAYKKTGFKLKNCVCELKDCGRKVSNGRYVAYILPATDERQVYLGYATFCCQKLGDVGESAMMHGLLNPKAGFFVIEEKTTHQIKAQAEVWEEDENSLVFDNIEFANDAELSHYKDILQKWLRMSQYETVKMGIGYNALAAAQDFTSCGKAVPSVTPYEVYVISHEEESEAPVFKSEAKAKRALDNGEVTYFDYVYCDSENSAVYLKQNGKLEPYFLSGLTPSQKQKALSYSKTLGIPALPSILQTIWKQEETQMLAEMDMQDTIETSESILETEQAFAQAQTFCEREEDEEEECFVEEEEEAELEW